MTQQQLAQMRDTDPQTVDRASLADIKSVQIDTGLPPQKRMEDYLRQIQNPYCFTCGKIVVKISFAEEQAGLEEKLLEYFGSAEGYRDST